ncbi:MAG TPA: hypothetical protein HA367_03840 [Candidatus Methanofastidiosum sp.]|nr:hypothetical protein [Methanofastidiosum sp.]
MKSLKEQDGKHYQKCTVVILPTEEASRLYLDIAKNKLAMTSDDPYYTQNFGGGTSNQQLYITSNEPIVEGDWYIKDNEIHQKLYGKTVIPSDARKIIATTDTLRYDTGKVSSSITCGDIPVYKQLPSPSPEFISAFIEAYNAGKPICSVLVEMITYYVKGNYSNICVSCKNEFHNTDKLGFICPDCSWKIKVDNQNCITIRKVKDNYTREEVAYFISACSSSVYSKLHAQESINKWIENNL